MSYYMYMYVLTFMYVRMYVHVGVYVPVGGKKLLTYLDDLNMPAKDEYGSQPPLELVRQWIDYGFWYDRLKQTMKEIRVRTLSFHILSGQYYTYVYI